MLKLLRKKTKVVIWSVVVCFALWGGFSVGTQFQKKGRIAGEVFGREISFQEFNRFYRSSQIFSFEDKPVQDPGFAHRQAWQNLIFSKEARRRKIDVPDDEVRSEILRLLNHMKIENPSTEMYRRWLDQTVRESPQEFESQVRELLRVQKLLREIQIELSKEKFLTWSMELIQKADLKDYTPQAEETAPAE